MDNKEYTEKLGNYLYQWLKAELDLYNFLNPDYPISVEDVLNYCEHKNTFKYNPLPSDLTIHNKSKFEFSINGIPL